MKLSKILRTVFHIALFFCCNFILADDKGPSGSQVIIEYFFQPGCAECELIKKNVLPVLEERYQGLFALKKYDTGIKDNFLRLAAYQDKFNMNENQPVFMVINDQYILAGYKQISTKIYDIIDKLVSEENNTPVESSVPVKTNEPDASVLEKRAANFKIGTVITAGLIDGVNPCVFSTLVFFLSLLSISGIKGFKLLLTGSIYCVACFVTYLAIGIGLFRMLKLFSGYHYLQISINAFMILVLIIFAILSFRDAWRYYISGESSSVTLKLPASLQSRIHKIMRKGLSYKYLIPGSFFIGVLVTIIESVCTGQVYVPTLVLLTQDSGVFSRWFMYLLLYNIMFIIPLIIIFIAAYSGIKTLELVKWSRTNLIITKTLLGLFFLLLAVLMLLI